MICLTNHYPVREVLERIRASGHRTVRGVRLTAEDQGMVIVLGNGLTAGYLRERLRLPFDPVPGIQELTSPIDHYSGMLVVHRASLEKYSGLAISPVDLPPQTDLDVDVLRAIYTGIALGMA